MQNSEKNLKSNWQKKLMQNIRDKETKLISFTLYSFSPCKPLLHLLCSYTIYMHVVLDLEPQLELESWLLNDAVIKQVIKSPDSFLQSFLLSESHGC